MPMKTRTFLKLGAAILANPFASPLLRWIKPSAATASARPGGGTMTNWAGNLTVTVPKTCPRSARRNSALELVKKHGKLKVLGTRHCFNGIADSTHHLISLRPMDQVVALDREGAYGDGRSGDELRAIVPLSP